LWQVAAMIAAPESTIHRKLIDQLYLEAMLLADEARGYFDAAGLDDRGGLTPLQRVAFSCESLKVTTRLMHVIAWLLTQRAVDAGEMARSDALDPSRRLGAAPAYEAAAIEGMPAPARSLISASADLYRRVARLDAAQAVEAAPPSPARRMLDRLASSF
jgi:regulator of CtrA degradation